jgi:tRNA dimethylallyltransferase
MGPTGTGKTALAVSLAERLPVEIVSVDSAMVYRGLDIGTAKPDAALRQRCPHRLIDIRAPTEAYSAADFRADARREIAEIHARGRIPLLVGGTGLYFRALERGLAVLPPSDPAVRARLKEELASQGRAALHQRLTRIDPEAAARIHPHDPQRLLRALEIHEISGASRSALYRADQHAGLPHPAIKIALEPTDRAALGEQLARRFHGMLAAGLEDEVAALLALPGLAADCPATRLVGYRQLGRSLGGEWPRATAIEQAIAATRQLAKRQLTWLRGEAGVEWLPCQRPGLAAAVAERIRAALPA